MQAVAVSLEPKETGGRVQLNLEALDLGDAYCRASLPPVHTTMPSVSAFPSLPISSEIQPAVPDSQQVTAIFIPRATFSYICGFPFHMPKGVDFLSFMLTAT